MISELAVQSLADVGAVRLVVGGGSMAPLIPDRSAVVVRRVEPAAIRAADAVLVRAAPGRMLLHRVLRVRRSARGRRFLLKGDRLGRCDGWFGEDQVLGCVSEVCWPSGIEIAGSALAVLGRLAAVLSIVRIAAFKLTADLSKTSP